MGNGRRKAAKIRASTFLGVQPGEEESAFMERMFSGVVENAAEIDRRIEGKTPAAGSWSASPASIWRSCAWRPAKLMQGKTPQAVVINEAVEMARQYSGGKIAAVRARRARQHLKEPGAMKCALGVDTSCYTTSVGAGGGDGRALQPPPAPRRGAAARGAFGSPRPCSSMCSACPALMEDMFRRRGEAQIACVCASARPRDAEGSYMPGVHGGNGLCPRRRRRAARCLFTRRATSRAMCAPPCRGAGALRRNFSPCTSPGAPRKCCMCAQA